MAMQHIEDELRKTGDPSKQTFADLIAVIHRSVGEDIPFPKVPTLANRLKIIGDPRIQALADVVTSLEVIADNFSRTPVIPKVVKEPESAKPEAIEATEATEVIEVHPENPFDLKWQAQAARYVKLGFDRELGYKTSEDYIATLPKFGVQPEEYKGRLHTPLIVPTGITPLSYMISLVGIDKGYPSGDAGYISDWGDGGFNTPKVPYSTWVSVEISNSDKSVKEVRGMLKADERWGNIFDGLALYLENPKILDGSYLVLLGSQVRNSDHVPILHLDNVGDPILRTLSVEDSYMGLLKRAFVVAGRNIIIKS